MQYSILETIEAADDVINFASYMIRKFKNYKAADDFLNRYDDEVKKLEFFPTGYRGIGILRVLKDKQNWNDILHIHTTYHFDDL